MDRAVNRRGKGGGERFEAVDRCKSGMRERF